MRAALTAGLCLLLAGVTPAAAHACPSETLYLAVGDSLTAGLQPDLGEARAGGYVGAVRRHLAEDGRVRLRNLACSGETTHTFRQGGHCSYDRGSQLAQAVETLRGHDGPTVITLTLGANDVQKCATATGIDMTCVQTGLRDVATNAPAILTALRDASPAARIVVLNYYNPILARWGTGEGGQAIARASAALATTLNTTLKQAAESVHASTADVAADFVSDTFTPGPTGVPLNVETVCSWTWACSKNDIHPNDDGYAVLGSAAVAALVAE